MLIVGAEDRSFIEGAEIMTTVTVSTQIAAPVPRAFQRFTDVEHGPARVSGIKRIEMLLANVKASLEAWRCTQVPGDRT